MSDDLDSLIGGADKPRLPDSDPLHRSRVLRMVSGGKGTFVDAGELKRPVTANFLALVFDMDPATVKKRLLPLPPLSVEGTANAPRPVWDFKDAVSYLLPPKMDLASYIKSLDPNKLPNHINKIFWDAMRTRLRFFIEAGQAWSTEAVLTQFGKVFMLIKDRVPLITEKLRQDGVPDDVCDKVQAMHETFLGDLYKELVDMPKKHQTMHLFSGDATLGPDPTEGEA